MGEESEEAVATGEHAAGRMFIASRMCCVVDDSCSSLVKLFNARLIQCKSA